MQTKVTAAQAKQNQSHSQPQTSHTAQTQFENSRPESVAQLNQQAYMSNSPQIKQLQAMQAMMAGNIQLPVQRVEESEPLQAKIDQPIQREQTEAPAPKPNNTGLPDSLKTGIENLSGLNMDHVRVHYNSDKPAQLQAHAYAQGNEIHVAPGQEKHLPHEAWHVVQQAQGRVKPTMQMKVGVPVNDDEGLEREADVMGNRALASVQLTQRDGKIEPVSYSGKSTVVQGMIIPIGEVASLPDKPTTKEREAAEAIDTGLARIDKAGNGRIVRLDNDDKPLRALVDTEELVIFAHGGAYGDDDAAVDYFGGLSPMVLADRLIKIGLKKTYRGVIYLNGCNSATEDTHPRPKKSYIWRFREAMLNSGYGISVKGNAAKIHIMEDGSAGFDRPGLAEKNAKTKILMNSIKSKIDEFNLAMAIMLKSDEFFQNDPEIRENVGLDENASVKDIREKLEEIASSREAEIKEKNKELGIIKPENEKEIYEARPDLIKTLKRPETDNEVLVKVVAVGFSFFGALILAPMMSGLGEHPYTKYVMALVALLAVLKILLNSVNSRK